MDRSLSDATTPGQSGPGNDGNEGVLRILQSPSITEASSSNCLVSYSGHSLEESYPSVEMQSVYSAVPANWARINLKVMVQSRKTPAEVFHKYFSKCMEMIPCNAHVFLSCSKRSARRWLQEQKAFKKQVIVERVR